MSKIGGLATLNHIIKAIQHHTQPTKHHNPKTRKNPTPIQLQHPVINPYSPLGLALKHDHEERE